MSRFLIVINLLVMLAMPSMANQESYSAQVADTNLIINTHNVNYVKVRGVRLIQHDHGDPVTVELNIEMIKNDGSTKFEQYSQTLQLGTEYYDQLVVDGKLVNIGE